MADKGSKKTVHRDSGSGQFTTKSNADKHPKTTEKERVSTGSPTKKK
jgi:hypothetical protein